MRVDLVYPSEYSMTINHFDRTEHFDRWLSKLKDVQGKAKILVRIRSAEKGNFGDCESVGEGVSEMRIHTGPGYRVYFLHGVATPFTFCLQVVINQRKSATLLLLKH
jgi:putative addiction module killer protein